MKTKMLGVEVETGVYISLISVKPCSSLCGTLVLPLCTSKTSKTVHIHWREMDVLGLVFTAETKGQQTKLALLVVVISRPSP